MVENSEWQGKQEKRIANIPKGYPFVLFDFFQIGGATDFDKAQLGLIPLFQ